MASRPRVRSVALRRLEGHNKSPDRSSSSSRSKEKGGAKSTGRKERDRPISRQEKPSENRARTERSRSKRRSKSTSRHRSRSPVHRREQPQERSTNIEHDDSRPGSPRPRNYDIEKSLEVLIRKQEESMKHMQRLEEKINRAKTRDQGSSKAKQTLAEFQYKRNKIQYELNAEVIDKIEEAMKADKPEERNRVLREVWAYSNIETSGCLWPKNTGGTLSNITKRNHWLKTLMMKRRFVRQSRKAGLKKNRGKSNESEEGYLKTLHKFKQTLFQSHTSSKCHFSTR